MPQLPRVRFQEAPIVLPGGKDPGGHLPPWQAWRSGSQRGHFDGKLMYLSTGWFSSTEIWAKIYLPCFFWPQCARNIFPSRFRWPFLANERRILSCARKHLLGRQVELAHREELSSFGEATHGLDLVYLLCLYSLLKHKLGFSLLHCDALRVSWGAFSSFLILISTSEQQIKQLSLYTSGFQLQPSWSPPLDFWQCLESFLMVKTGEEVLWC